VIDLRTLKPLDEATLLRSVRKTGRLVVACEAVRTGGSANEVVALAAEEAFDALKAPIVRVAPPDVPVPFHRSLEKAYPTVADAIAAAGLLSAREPWLERAPLLLRATPVPLGTGRWALSDATGCVPIVPGFWRTAELVAVSGGRPITLAAEWSVDGVLPLTVWADGLAVQL